MFGLLVRVSKPLTNTHTEPRFRGNLKALGRRFGQVFPAIFAGQSGALAQPQNAGCQDRGRLAEAFVWRQARRISAIGHGVAPRVIVAHGATDAATLAGRRNRGPMLLTYRTRVRVVRKNGRTVDSPDVESQDQALIIGDGHDGVMAFSITKWQKGT
jgi:hypothetical protein